MSLFLFLILGGPPSPVRDPSLIFPSYGEREKAEEKPSVEKGRPPQKKGHQREKSHHPQGKSGKEDEIKDSLHPLRVVLLSLVALLLPIRCWVVSLLQLPALLTLCPVTFPSEPFPNQLVLKFLLFLLPLRVLLLSPLVTPLPPSSFSRGGSLFRRCLSSSSCGWSSVPSFVELVLPSSKKCANVKTHPCRCDAPSCQIVVSPS